MSNKVIELLQKAYDNVQGEGVYQAGMRMAFERAIEGVENDGLTNAYEELDKFLNETWGEEKKILLNSGYHEKEDLDGYEEGLEIARSIMEDQLEEDGYFDAEEQETDLFTTCNCEGCMPDLYKVESVEVGPEPDTQTELTLGQLLDTIKVGQNFKVTNGKHSGREVVMTEYGLVWEDDAFNVTLSQEMFECKFEEVSFDFISFEKAIEQLLNGETIRMHEESRPSNFVEVKMEDVEYMNLITLLGKMWSTIN